ncbi:MAG: hypothetical protein HY815_20200, partial [Candidatus Riflebacteria bacterium]|nr:hypothetical protein [Candidatus Riflebacteria bacterium]
GRSPIVVAHGKNVNVAEESTWANLVHSVESGATVLEVDLQMLKPRSGFLGEFFVFHDPTPHRLVRGYRTPPEKEAEFIRSSRELAEQKQGQYDFYLFDRMGTFTPEDDKATLWIHDERSGRSYEPILLDEILAAIRRPGSFDVPRHLARTAEGHQVEVPAARVTHPQPVFYYLDLKDINPLARRLIRLSCWDWERNSWSTSRLVAYTRALFSSLSAVLTRCEAHDKVFVAVRHEALADMVREIDPRIKIMASTERAVAATPVREFVVELQRFEPHHPELVEVKFLGHIVEPELHGEARARGWQLFYNEIVQTDRSQFEGRYEGNLPLLIKDILAPSPDVFIQTNTVPELVDLLKRLPEARAR